MTQESFVLPKEKMACSLGQGKTTERRQQTKPPWINVTKVVLSLPKDTCQKSLKEGLPNSISLKECSFCLMTMKTK